AVRGRSHSPTEHGTPRATNANRSWIPSRNRPPDALRTIPRPRGDHLPREQREGPSNARVQSAAPRNGPSGDARARDGTPRDPDPCDVNSGIRRWASGSPGDRMRSLTAGDEYGFRGEEVILDGIPHGVGDLRGPGHPAERHS